MRRIIAGIVCLGIVGCEKSAEKSGDTASTDTTQAGEVSLGSLKLSESLSPTVPMAVTGTGEGLDPVQAGEVAIALTEETRKKSMEACYIRQKLKEAKANQESMAMQLCYIQSQKGMKPGGKYKMKFAPPGAALTQDMPPPDDMPPGDVPTTGGPGEMPADPTGGAEGGMPPGGAGEDMDLSFFLDNSVADQFTVYLCQSDKLSQKIVVSGSEEGGSKGSYKAAMDMMGMGSMEIQGAFDNGVEVPGHQRSASQISFEMTMGESTSYIRSSINLDLVEDSVSVVKTATETASSATDFSNSFREIGTAFIGPKLGAALFQRTLDGDQKGGPDPMALTEAQVITTRSYFDNAGQTLAKEDSPAFADGGKLAVADTDLPKLVPETFKVEFEATDWDCSGTEEFDMDTESEEFKACTEKFASQFEMETCTDAAYLQGPEAADVPPVIEVREVEGIPELPPPPPAP